MSVGAKLSATFLSDDVALPPMSAELKPIEVEAPKFVRQGAIGLVALIALLLGAGIGPLKTVLVGVASAEASESPEEQVARVDFAALEPELKSLGEPEALDRLTAFVQAHPGTKTADAAAERIGPLEEKIFGEQRRQVEEIVAKAEKAEKAGQLGPALDELDAVTPELAKVPGAPDVAGLRAKLRAGLQARGWPGCPPAMPGPAKASTCARCSWPGSTSGSARSPAASSLSSWPRRAATRRSGGRRRRRRGPEPAGRRGRRAPGDRLRGLARRAASQEHRVGEGGPRPGGQPVAVGRQGRARGLQLGRQPAGEADGRGELPKDVSPFGCLDMAGNVAELTLGPGSTDADPVVWARGAASARTCS